MDDISARNLLKAAWQKVLPSRPYNAATLQAVQSIASLETTYGGSWHGAGAGSWNMGAVTGQGSAGSFQYGDSRPGPNGTIHYVTAFAKYATALDGMAGLLTWFAHRPECIDAADAGFEPDFSAAMYARHYFTGVDPDPNKDIRVHAQTVMRHATRIAASCGEPLALVMNVDDAETIGLASDPTSGETGSSA